MQDDHSGSEKGHPFIRIGNAKLLTCTNCLLHNVKSSQPDVIGSHFRQIKS